MRGSSRFSSLEILLKGPVGLILPAVRSVMGGMCAPMFLAERAMLLCATSVRNMLTNRDHLLLG